MEAIVFTGIIRHTGTVMRFQPAPTGARLTLGAPKLAGVVANGDSIAVNGVCLTAAGVHEALIEFDVIDETLRRSTLASVRNGKRVNLERSLCVGDTVDGHFVQGHIDGTARLQRRDTQSGQHVLWFDPEPQLVSCIIPKGSIAIDGVSLTIAEVAKNSFSVAVIPTTIELTTLTDLRVDDRVNIETDIIARAVVHRLDMLSQDGGLTRDRLKSLGFA